LTDVLYAGFLGLIAGLVPVYIGLAPLWIFKRLSVGWRTALVSFSAGILLFALGLGLGLLGPVAITHIRRRKMASRTPAPPSDTPSKPIVSAKLFTAQMIALGIGLHNLGEGLAIGAAYAAGVFGLTNLLVIGFALHNSTEGLGISGPIASTNRGARDPLLLGFLAGSPTILGSMIGSLAYSPALGTLFFSAAAGALLYVIVELVKVTSTPEPSKLVFVGIVIGMVLMFGTGLLVR